VSTDARSYWIPGRIEFLGKHTDYAGGRSLVCAIERGLTLHVTPRAEARMRVTDILSGETAAFDLSPALAPRAGHWSNYFMTVARRLARDFPACRHGVDIAFGSDLPQDAGLSSSSALVVGCYAALASANDLPLEATPDLAGYLGAVESGAAFGDRAGDAGVGTHGGSQDHVAILCSRSGELGQYAFRPVRHERQVPLPTTHVFVIAVSGVAAPKTGAAREAYNRVAAALADRREQLVAESEEIVPAAGDALLTGDLSAVGVLVDRSQALAERYLGNQVPETIFLARSARELGAAAASAFGAGFGGSVWALVVKAQADDFRHRWLQRYTVAFPARADRAASFVTRAAAGLSRL
jgi:galactokinase